MGQVVRFNSATRPTAPLGCTVVVIGPEGDISTSNDLLRLFECCTVGEARTRRIGNCAKIAVRCGPDLVGLAAYRQSDGLLEVLELVVEEAGRCSAHDVVRTLLHALESACLAGGGRRVVLVPEAASHVPRDLCSGYTATGQSASAGLEKTLL